MFLSPGYLCLELSLVAKSTRVAEIKLSSCESREEGMDFGEELMVSAL